MALLFFIATFTAAMITACKPVETKYRVTFIANDKKTSRTVLMQKER